MADGRHIESCMKHHLLATLQPGTLRPSCTHQAVRPIIWTRKTMPTHTRQIVATTLTTSDIATNRCARLLSGQDVERALAQRSGMHETTAQRAGERGVRA